MTPAAADWLRLILGLATMGLGAGILAGAVAGVRAITVLGRTDAGEERKQ
ncbi:MAG: hypothetical protein HOQ07_08410 [Sinomonas sp.]|nr:hypothetical protein [Sinomonas sp.]